VQVDAPKAQTALNEFFSANEDWTPADLLLLWLRAKELQGVTADNGYQYPACQHADQPDKLIQHLDLIFADTKSQDLPGMKIRKVVAQIEGLSQLDGGRIESFFDADLQIEFALEPAKAKAIEHHIDKLDQKEVESFDCLPLSPGQRLFLIAAFCSLAKYEIKTRPEKWIDDIRSIDLDEPAAKAAAAVVEKMSAAWRRWKDGGPKVDDYGPPAPEFVGNVLTALQSQKIITAPGRA
jgi:hypothetical protein